MDETTFKQDHTVPADALPQHRYYAAHAPITLSDVLNLSTDTHRLTLEQLIQKLATMRHAYAEAMVAAEPG